MLETTGLLPIILKKENTMKKKSILCKLGFHKVDKEQHMVRRNRKNCVTSRSAFCKKCDKKLYRVNKYGDKRR
jgi:hypothetical protein